MTTSSTTTRPLEPLALADVQIDGRIGAQLHRVLSARFTSERARGAMVDEIVAALERRVDDRLKPGIGLWQGEFFGKWALGAVDAYRYTGDSALHACIDQAATRVLATQDADGYIGSYHDPAFGMCDEPIFEWNIWCRKYTLWGLLAIHGLLGRPEILAACVRLADHLIAQVGPGGWPIQRTGTFAGLPSTSILAPIVRLYHSTSEPRFLVFARHIVQAWSADPDAPPDLIGKGRSGIPIADWFADPQHWAKAYEFMSCVEGLCDLAEATNDDELLATVGGIVELIAAHEVSIVGGVAHNDKFGNARYLVQTPSELCESVHWFRLNQRLCRLRGAARYAAAMERTLHNSLAAATSCSGHWGLRRQLLAGRHWIAPQHCQLAHQQCCVANVPRGLLQAAQSAVMRSDAGPVVQLILPGRYRVGAGCTLTIDSDYPADGRVRFSIDAALPSGQQLHLRMPEGCSLAADHGQVVDDYLALAIDPDHPVELALRMPTRQVAFPAQGKGRPQPFHALCRGPLVLARDRRLGEAIHDEVDLAADADGAVATERIAPPEGIYLALRARCADGAQITLCDAASAGNSWDIADSDFRIWLPCPSHDPFGSVEPQI